MDESVGMMSVAAVLVFGIWLVDYSGDAARASSSIRSASVEAAQYAASALGRPPEDVDDAELGRLATGIAERVVGAAAISDCDAGERSVDIAAAVHRLPDGDEPAALSVEVVCPLTASPLFADAVRTEVAVPLDARLAAQP